jgi:hypothetical protein
VKDLLVAVPSRGRPQNIARLYEAMQVTCRADTQLLVGLDDDDPAGEYYPTGPDYEVRGGLRQVVAWLNALVVPRTGDYRAVGHIGDDNLPRTPGWDVKMLEALEKTPFAFGNDLYPREPGSLCCHLFCRSNVVDALGYLGYPKLKHMFVDPIWMEWGKAAGITYLHEVIIEHMHYTVGKAVLDTTYAQASAPWLKDEAVYNAYLTDPAGLAADVARIVTVL